MRVTSSSSSLHDTIKLTNDINAIPKDYDDKLTEKELSALLGLKGKKSVTAINRKRLLIYKFYNAQRTEPDTTDKDKQESFGPPALSLPLPPLPDDITDGAHYVVAEVLFDYDVVGCQNMHWRAFIEPISVAVLYLRALVSGATGQVFTMDPISQSGDDSMIPAANEADLNVFRSLVPLTDLVAADPQNLHGDRVDLHEIQSPVATDPTETSPYVFNYSVKTTDFSAVNAYYHVNWFFNLIKGMGFDLDSYFDGTTFPVQVDHWSLGGASTVNAHCPGNATGDGVGHFCFASAQSGQTVGIADDVRVVIHEFGHALLWDHVGSPNFGFAHSAGDALGAILLDPISRAPDRFLTFPWPQGSSGPLDRRHDRAVADGWGWFGSRWNTQYGGEQVLSTTLFRVYLSAGGDSPHLADRFWAARYVSFLIIKAIGTLTSTTTDPEVFVTALMNADVSTVDFEGHPGGSLHKIIRWAFEKQGLFQSNAVYGGSPPVATEGNPPDVDVYIDDGRNGEYPYLYNFWESTDIWVRHRPDGGTVHQPPRFRRFNYMYVRVKNRGTQTANNVVVKAYRSSPGAGLAWPHQWLPMATTHLPAPGPIPSGGETIVGPFRFVPRRFRHQCLLAIASADGDAGNDATVAGTISPAHFIPFDNNIAQRNIQPVLFYRWQELLKHLRRLSFIVTNPYDKPVNVSFGAVLPEFMQKKRLWVFFMNPGGHKFILGPHAQRRVVFSITGQPPIPKKRPWKPLAVFNKPGVKSPEDLIADFDAANPDSPGLSNGFKFRIITHMNGQNVGGMTYRVIPAKLTGVARSKASIALDEISEANEQDFEIDEEVIDAETNGVEDEDIVSYDEIAGADLDENDVTSQSLNAASIVKHVKRHQKVRNARIRRISLDVDLED